MTIDQVVVDMAALERELTEDEGRRNRRYRCPAGHWTIGIGHNLEGKHLPPDIWAAIKVENPHVENALLDEQVMISNELIDRLFRDDIGDAIDTLDTIWIGWRALSECRKRALINLSFQMGGYRLLGFVKFWRAMRSYDFVKAALELQFNAPGIETPWYRDTQPSRTSRVIKQIREG